MVILVGNVEGLGGNFIELSLGGIWNVGSKVQVAHPKRSVSVS